MTSSNSAKSDKSSDFEPSTTPYLNNTYMYFSFFSTKTVCLYPPTHTLFSSIPSESQSHLFQSGTWRSGSSTLEGRITPSQSYQTMMKMSNDVFGGNTLIVTTLIVSIPWVIYWACISFSHENSYRTIHQIGIFSIRTGYCIINYY
jgi:hypothetical protein